MKFLSQAFLYAEAQESFWKCLHSLCVYFQSPSGFVCLFCRVQFLIWCLLVTFLTQRQSPKKDWHLLTEGGVGRGMDYLCPLFDLNIVLIKQPQLRSERVAFPAMVVVTVPKWNICHLKLRDKTAALWSCGISGVIGPWGVFSRRIDCWQMSLRVAFKDAQGSRSHVMPRHSATLLHHPYCWKTGLQASHGSSHHLKTITSYPIPPKSLCMLSVCSVCFNIECSCFREHAEAKKTISGLRRWLTSLFGWAGAWLEGNYTMPIWS